MKRRLAMLLAVAATTLGFTVVTAAPASAATLTCGTTSYSWPEIDAVAGGQIKIIGTHTASYVGSYAGFTGTYRFWHFTFTANGGSTGYTGASAVLCDADGNQLGVTDLTREADELTQSDHPKCGTISYTVGSSSYTYIGGRSNNGDRFRYWGQSVYNGTFYFRGPSAVRCD